jgi:hypothetical protein
LNTGFLEFNDDAPVLVVYRIVVFFVGIVERGETLVQERVGLDNLHGGAHPFEIIFNVVALDLLDRGEFCHRFIVQCLTGFVDGDERDQSQRDQADDDKRTDQFRFYLQFVEHCFTFLFGGTK